jgi:prepilin-type processing-associated H-X9-DG protein
MTYAYTWYVAVAGISFSDGYGYIYMPNQQHSRPLQPARAGIFSCLAIRDANRNFSVSFPRVADVTDGMSNTLMLGERPPAIAGVDKCWTVEGLWNQPGHYVSCGADGILPDGNIYTDGGNLPPSWNRVGATCPQVAYPGPADLNHCCSLNHFGSFHTGGANFAFGDGSVRFLSYDIVNKSLPPTSQVPNGAQTVFEALCTRAGGEVVDASDY